MLKTSKALSSGDTPAFRIELYEEDGYDIIWQANGKEEEIALLVDKEDLIELERIISNAIHSD